MRSIPLFNKNAGLFAVAACVLSLIFLYFNYGSTYYDGYRLLHGDIAYNMLEEGLCKGNAQRYAYLREIWEERKQVPEIYETIGIDCGAPTSYPTNDIHIGYSLVMACVWFFTHSYRYLDIALLQIFMFCLLLFFFYQIGYLLFGSEKIASYCCGALVLFFPLIFLNVQILRDIWPFYGIIALLYGTLSYINNQSSYLTLFLCGSLFAFCQFIRPPTFVTLLTLSLILIGYALFEPLLRARIVTIISIFVLTNILVFWIPFCAFNKYAYDRFFVSPVGQNLLEGLGEFSNPWGYRLEDYWYGTYMKNTYGLSIGSQEADDKAKELFWQAVHENPMHYIACIMRRVHRIILPALGWFPWLYNDKVYDAIESFKDRVKYLASHLSQPAVLFDFILRHLYVRLYLLIGYIGVVLLLLRKKLFAVLLLYGGIIVSSYTVIFSHIEHRYLIPAFGVLPFFVGYAFYALFNRNEDTL